MKDIIIKIILITVLSFQSFSQELPTILPQSPEAASIGKYGQIPVGLFTGTPQVHVPIHEFTSGQLTVPISLNCSPNGVRIDEYASSVGIGWSLFAGGVITEQFVDIKMKINIFLPVAYI